MSIHHDTLGIQPTDDKAAIKKAYKRMASKHHPDKGGDEEQFKKVTEAYERLTDPDKFTEPKRQGPAGWQQWNPQDFGGGNPRDMFEELLRKHQQDQRDYQQSIQVRMQLDLESTLHEQVRNLDLREHGIAPTMVTIPAGIRHGEAMRFPVSPLNPANYNVTQITVQFAVLPPQDFQVAGDHLVKQTTVDAFDAMLGADLTIKTLDGKTLKVKLPKGSPPETKLKISGNGLPIKGTKIRGDLYVVVNISIPVLNIKEEHIIEQLREKRNNERS